MDPDPEEVDPDDFRGGCVTGFFWALALEILTGLFVYVALWR